jgi:subtilase family serine protease
MRVFHRPLKAGGAAVLGLAAVALTGVLGSAQPATAATSAASVVTPHLTAIKGSLLGTTDKAVGAYTASSMSAEVALTPRNEAGLSKALTEAYSKGSSQYHAWLAKGQFDARYAPAAAERAAVTSYLRGQGLSVAATDSPFLIRVTGSSARITAAFHTKLSSYAASSGVRYFANSTQVSLPAAIAGNVQGVVGLSNTVRLRSQAIRPAGKAKAGTASCEAGYVTTEELFAFTNKGTGFPDGYGGGPGCSGLTPSQTNSTYGAPAASPRTEGAGVNAAVFELSAYLPSDIGTWAKYFYGSGYKPDFTPVNVDGGPLSKYCPKGDKCTADYSGDIEVDADIEQEMSVAEDAHIYVYDAPNDETGQTELDEYTTIANQDIAATVSSSWGECEKYAGKAYVEAENTVFEQMALQGQSVFAAAGDDGAFDCLGYDGKGVNVDDPEAQPWVTSVGGTSLESDNPGTNPDPSYPANGTETVWNVDNLCSDQPKAAGNDNLGGYYWCENSGAGGGGSSEFWGEPFYQKGPGVISQSTTYGKSSCPLASGSGTPCREVPDISANADEYTGYAEYCTGSKQTKNSTCAQFGDGGGWFPIGGTSLSTPLWAALITDRVGYRGVRAGNINPLLYSWLDTDACTYFNDITGTGSLQQAATDNGLFPTTPGYDEATGAGTPKFAAIITG